MKNSDKLNIQNTDIKKIFYLINFLLSYPSLFIISILLLKKDKTLLISSLINLIICGILVISIKNLIRKKRSNNTIIKKRLFGNHYSFPSGHLSSNLSLFFILLISNEITSYIFLISSIIIIIYKLINQEHDFYDLFFAIFIAFFSAISSFFISYFSHVFLFSINIH